MSWLPRALVQALAFGLLATSLFGAVAQERGGPARSFEELSAALGESEPGARRRAVRDLAALDEVRAWELVVTALADSKGEVADEAQFRLAALNDTELWEDLLGRRGLGSEAPLVALRVAEAVGRARIEVDGRELLRRLSRRDDELSETLLWSIERLGRAGRLAGDRARLGRELAKLAREGKRARVAAQALCALAAVDEGAFGEALPRAKAAKQHELRVATLVAAVGEEALSLARSLRADEHPSVRLAALERIAVAGDKAALLLLLERLEVEERLRLRVACVEQLQRLSGRKTKLDPRPWRHWIERLPEDWTTRDRAPVAADVGGTASFAGLPVLSDRVCFLIDFSGSLWYEREGRPPRKGKVDELLRAALPRLAPETEFNVVPYTREPHPWRPSLVPATERNVRAALADFEACVEKGSGNAFDAVRLALSDRRVDRVVILTDGAPTGGARWKLELIVPLLEQAARFDRVAIDSIVVDARPGLRKHWEELARRTGGRSIGVEL